MSQQVHLRLGTRSSPLAMVQAEEACARLCAAHGWDEDAVELVPVLASGDKVQDRPLAEIGGKALWTKELDQWLAEGLIDAAVHSMKDVETIRPDWLAIAAVLPRADVRDVLVGADSLSDIPHSARVGTSSPRRAAQLLHHRRDCTIVPLRGNVATRLAKLEAGEADAIVLAAAGLIRLGMGDVGHLLPADLWLPAVAQGAIGIECRTDDAAARELLTAIDHAPSRDQVLAERALLEGLGGTCHSPVGVICTQGTGEGELWMEAALFSPDGRDRVAIGACFDAGDPRLLMDISASLLRDAPASITALFRGSA